MRGAAGRIAKADNSAAVDTTNNAVDTVDATHDATIYTSTDADEHAIDATSHPTARHSTRGADVNTCADDAIDARHYAAAATVDRGL